ncbi:Citrate lyase subunit beta-like protein, mitochondrial [Hypsibius exemplaris]|uniref:Citramalyl-CoA lyase, mitochondrial n=1 Tax=Hypsibius exemplaris TaxID=2072580 RepID=A0A1W0X2W4_HYPEX|nr:Citrate lyase subunit beta-like protein, mitochondrial [Hypsibius exemplaris]
MKLLFRFPLAFLHRAKLSFGPVIRRPFSVGPKGGNCHTSPVSSQNASDQQRWLPHIPRRAVMYIPGDDVKKIAKIPTLNVDCPVLECEDGVAVARKEAARSMIVSTLNNAEWVKTRKSRALDVAVRINSIQSGLADDDLNTVLSASVLPTTLFVPKIEEEDHISWLANRLGLILSGRITQAPLRLILYIESAHALMQMRRLLKTALSLADGSGSLFALDGVVFGSDDYCADIGATRSKEATELIFARQFFVSAAKSFQRPIQAIDLVHIDFKDLSDLKRQAEEGARWGFTGKQVIHPAQVETVQRAFSPSPERIQWANDLITAFEEHQKLGKGAFTFQNSMIDMPLLLQAQNVVAQAKQLNL